MIGDEILKGGTQDTNSFFISQRLRDKGVILKKVSDLQGEGGGG